MMTLPATASDVVAHDVVWLLIVTGPIAPAWLCMSRSLPTLLSPLMATDVIAPEFEAVCSVILPVTLNDGPLICTLPMLFRPVPTLMAPRLLIPETVTGPMLLLANTLVDTLSVPDTVRFEPTIVTPLIGPD